jgi:hypothetical protein
MRAKIAAATTIILLGVGLLRADEPWKEKSYAEWTEQDVRKLRENSPWAKKPTIALPGRGSSTEPGYALLKQTDFTVRWSSSRTLREARVRYRQIVGMFIEGDVERLILTEPAYYVIAVNGPLQLLFGGLGDAEVLSSASLELENTKHVIQAVDMRFPRGRPENGGGVVEFYFPRHLDGQAAISPTERRVVFRCTTGKTALDQQYVAIRAVFDLRKMVREGKPDL